MVRNRHRTQQVNSRQLGKILRILVAELLQVGSFELALYIVAAPEITRLNETFLHHEGPTDVLAFDYTEPADPTTLRGEVFVCIEEARFQAVRFRTSWQSELVRYMIHGLLHLRGYDDHRPASRREMKREENRLLKLLSGRFELSRL